MKDMQQIFGERLNALLQEKNISQLEFSKLTGCSRQSINLYILCKRTPDIVVAANMAKILGVSCDYLVGLSEFRSESDANITVNDIGIYEETAKVFSGLKIAATNPNLSSPLGMDNAQDSLRLLNNIISHDKFGVMLQYVKRYKDILHNEDILSMLDNFMVELESPYTHEKYGSFEENVRLKGDFCLHIATKYFNDIVIDVSK